MLHPPAPGKTRRESGPGPSASLVGISVVVAPPSPSEFLIQNLYPWVVVVVVVVVCGLQGGMRDVTGPGGTRPLSECGGLGVCTWPCFFLQGRPWVPEPRPWFCCCWEWTPPPVFLPSGLPLVLCLLGLWGPHLHPQVPLSYFHVFFLSESFFVVGTEKFLFFISAVS